MNQINFNFLKLYKVYSILYYELFSKLILMMKQTLLITPCFQSHSSSPKGLTPANRGFLQIIIQNRDYSSFYIIDTETKEKISDNTITIDPIHNKMFSNDLFYFHENKIVIESSLVKQKEIPGILILENNKTYGRTNNKKRLLYKFIPNNKQLPAFLVPYEIQLGFNKVFKNKYATIRYDSWIGQHPQGLLLQTLGNIDELPIFYEYQLYCRELHHSMSRFINEAKKNVCDIRNSELFLEKNIMEDRRKTHHVFSIDPIGSTDLDDAFSIRKIDEEYEISIYIANVFIWMEFYKMWDSFSERVATIYLPDKRRPLLPTIFSENLCSLLQGKDRFAFTMTILIDSQGIKESRFSQTIIHVNKNYHYDEMDSVNDKHYNTLYEITRRLSPDIKNSHELVAFWMIQMNSVSANILKKGIFRSSAAIKGLNPLWQQYTGNYILVDENNEKINIAHESLGLENYLHITSPIRRLVDIMNQTLLIKQLGIYISPEADAFIETRLKKIGLLNLQMKAITKVQCDCELVYKCFTNPEIVKNNYKGIICEKNKDLDNDYFHYLIYLEDISLMTRMKCKENLEEGTTHLFNIFLFEDEDKIQKKIRLQMVKK